MAGGGNVPDFYAITPDGEHIYPDKDGVLHCKLEDTVVTLGGGGSGDDCCTKCSKPRPKFYCWEQDPDVICPYGFTEHAGPAGSRPLGWFDDDRI
jgi:hypothetical protein